MEWFVIVGCAVFLGIVAWVLRRYYQLALDTAIKAGEYEAKEAQLKVLKTIFIVNLVLLAAVEFIVAYGLLTKT